MIIIPSPSPPIYGTNASDVLTGTNDDDILHGNEGNDYLYDDAGEDLLHGNDGNDELYGGDGNDFLHGGAGYDEMSGGDGYDEMSGGDGRDRFHYQYPNEGWDTIHDFQVGSGVDADVINLENLLYDYDSSDPAKNDITKFISFNDDGTDTTLIISPFGRGVFNIFSNSQVVVIYLQQVTGVSLSDMINDGNIVLV